MTEAEVHDGEDISLFALGTTLLRKRWRIVRWMLLGGGIGALLGLLKPPLYLASASFVPQGNDASRSGLASLAGQLGVSLPASNQSLSPEFYASLLKSRVLLLPIARDSFVIAERGPAKIAFVDLFKLSGPSEAAREEEALALLNKKIVGVSMSKLTGVVGVSAGSQWRSVSLDIVTKLVNGVSDFNEKVRQGQAAAERRFIGERLAVASAELRAAEDRLEGFLRTNRDLGHSPQLIIQRERFQRDLSLRQQVFTTLTQSYEDARIREVRDTPVITIFEPPAVPTQPERRGRFLRVAVGMFLGGAIGVGLVLFSAMMARRRAEGDEDANEFFGALDELKAQLRRSLRWAGRRRRDVPGVDRVPGRS
jgi:uncharacterized protein involved in exopolysaccharide biosynthesis